MNALRFARFAAAFVFALSVTAAHAITIDWVTVGDPGNAGQTLSYNGTNMTFGAVAASFRIMKYEFTNQQYVAFLNAVDPDGTNPDSIWHPNMDSNARGGISFTTGTTAGSKYASKTNMADKPVNYVSWFDAARVSNWLHAGGISYGTSVTGSAAINDGAYTLSGSTTGDRVAVNPGAAFSIPTEDQWYKAAYYKGGSTNADYWEYATQVTGTAPTAVAVTAGLTGIGVSGSTGNYANFNRGADWGSPLQDGNVTTVGTNGGPSAYGAFDMSGNITELNDFTGVGGSKVGVRGGDWDDFEAIRLSSSFRISSFTTGHYSDYGFRLAGSLGVPEIDPAGLGSVLALVTGVLGLFERRRSRR